MKTMLLVFAHPDDESFSAGGTIAKYKKMGWKIELLVATNGEKGQSGSLTDITEEELGALRQTELKAAAKVLGIRNITFLGQPDGGLTTLSPGTLEDPIAKRMLELLPDIVITHDTTGISNHPDHIKLCYATTFAFQKYTEHLETLKQPDMARLGRGKEWKEDAYLRAFGDLDPENKEPKLYYSCMPDHVASYMKKMKAIPEQSFGKPWVGTKDRFVTTAIDIEGFQIQKGKALLCHQTQQTDVDRFINFDQNPLHKQEYFILRMQGIHEVFMGKTDRVAEIL